VRTECDFAGLGSNRVDVPRAGSRSSGLGPDDQVNLAIENLQQRQELIDRLAIVGLIEQSIELSGGRGKPSRYLALGKGT
jgi:hypothetical protein